MKQPFPSDWSEQPCVIAAVPVPLAPFVGGLLKILENRGFWQDDEAFLNAYTAVTGVQECLMSGCLDELVESNRQIYRLLNTIHNGQLYSATGDTPDTIEPTIPLFPARGIVNNNSSLGRLELISEALQSFIAGVDTPEYSGSPNVFALLQAIIDALNAEETDLGDLLTQLELIVGLLA